MTITKPSAGRASSHPLFFGTILLALSTSTTPAVAAVGAAPDLGPNVLVFDPSMPVSQIQAAVDKIATQQVSNQFGIERYALLFQPGTYGSSTTPLNFKVGFYTEVAGLGASPDNVVINGSIDVYNQCDSNGCNALDNFWRSLSNLEINVTTPNAGCYYGEFWAVSQAAPLRRVHINGQTTLMDYCTGPSYASGLPRQLSDRRHHQWLAAAILRQEQHHRWLVERRLQPGLPRRTGRTRTDLPESRLYCASNHSD